MEKVLLSFTATGELKTNPTSPIIMATRSQKDLVGVYTIAWCTCSLSLGSFAIVSFISSSITSVWHKNGTQRCMPGTVSFTRKWNCGKRLQRNRMWFRITASLHWFSSFSCWCLSNLVLEYLQLFEFIHLFTPGVNFIAHPLFPPWCAAKVRKA